MKQVIGGKVYNTETADMIGYLNGQSYGPDFYHWSGTLYKTKKGAFFLAGHGGPASMFGKPCGNGGTTGSTGIIALSEDEALELCESQLDPARRTRLVPDRPGQFLVCRGTTIFARIDVFEMELSTLETLQQHITHAIQDQYGKEQHEDTAEVEESQG